MLIGLSKIHGGGVGLCTHLVSFWLRDKPVSSKLGTYGTHNCAWLCCVMQNLENVFSVSIFSLPIWQTEEHVVRECQFSKLRMKECEIMDRNNNTGNIIAMFIKYRLNSIFGIILLFFFLSGEFYKRIKIVLV